MAQFMIRSICELNTLLWFTVSDLLLVWDSLMLAPIMYKYYTGYKQKSNTTITMCRCNAYHYWCQAIIVCSFSLLLLSFSVSQNSPKATHYAMTYVFYTK